MEEWFNEDDGMAVCHSGVVLVAGVSLLPRGLLIFMYFLFLCYLFTGVAAIADLFMEAIEVITS